MLGAMDQSDHASIGTPATVNRRYERSVEQEHSGRPDLATLLGQAEPRTGSSSLVSKQRRGSAPTILLQYQVYLLDEVSRGSREIDRGEGIEHDEVKCRLAKWLET